MSAVEKLKAYLANSTNAQIATTLELAITGDSPEALELRNIENYIRTEARKRVGPAANAASDADWQVFKAKYGLHEGMTDAEMDAIYDTIPTDEMVPGEWFYLVAELRK